MRKILIASCLALAGVLAGSAAWARLPPLSEEQKFKAEEAKGKAAEAAKKAADALTQAQDRVAERYRREQQAGGMEVKPTSMPAAPGPPNPAPQQK